MKDVLFPTDFKANFKKLKLQVLHEVLRRDETTLHVLHTYTAQDESTQRIRNRENLKKLLGQVSLKWHDLGEHPIVAAINDFADRLPVQLLVMVRNEHTVLENLMVTPVIHKIGFHTQIPFLVIPPAGK